VIWIRLVVRVVLLLVVDDPDPESIPRSEPTKPPPTFPNAARAISPINEPPDDPLDVIVPPPRI
jgi:hypothetical protein